MYSLCDKLTHVPLQLTPCIVLYRVTWWQLGFNSFKEDICVTFYQLLVEDDRAGLFNMWYKCAHKRRSSIEAQREAKQWMVAKLNKEEYTGCMLSIKGYNCDQYLL